MNNKLFDLDNDAKRLNINSFAATYVFEIEMLYDYLYK